MTFSAVLIPVYEQIMCEKIMIGKKCQKHGTYSIKCLSSSRTSIDTHTQSKRERKPKPNFIKNVLRNILFLRNTQK